MTELNTKDRFIELIKSSPNYSDTQRTIRYAIALSTIIAFSFFRIFADFLHHGSSFAVIYTVLLFSYIAVYQKQCIYYFSNATTYHVLFKPRLFFEAWFELIKKDRIYWFRFADSFFACLPVYFFIVSLLLTPFFFIINLVQ